MTVSVTITASDAERLIERLRDFVDDRTKSSYGVFDHRCRACGRAWNNYSHLSGNPNGGNNEPLMLAMLPWGVSTAVEEVKPLSFERRHALALDCAQIIAEKGDVLQFKSKKKGESAQAFTALIRALAILALQPGGVVFCGNHFCDGK